MNAAGAHERVQVRAHVNTIPDFNISTSAATDDVHSKLVDLEADIKMQESDEEIQLSIKQKIQASIEEQLINFKMRKKKEYFDFKRSKVEDDIDIDLANISDETEKVNVTAH